MCLYSITTEYNELLKAAHVHIDDDRYDIVEDGAAGRPKLDLSDQLRCCSIAFKYVTQLSSSNVLV